MSHPNIEHGRNGKERKINRYFVDGFDPDTKTVYEYNGCVHHGHPECTNEDDRAPFSLKKMSEVYEQWIRKKLFLEGMGYNVEEKWSCESLRERKDPDIQQFLLNQNLRDPLQPREAFKGGRTNASCLFREVQEEEQILHYDIVSLYPFVNKKAEYPIGHPKIIVTNFKPVTEYFGLVKCKVLPPARIRYLVLPATFNGKLVFTLCRTCVENGINDYCSHSDEERSFEGVFCTAELHMALRQGYQVQEIYEVWHWNEKRAGLFQEYVDKFLKEKLETSGFPAGCTTQRQKELYVQEVALRDGIVLDIDRVEDNPARRAVAKLMLNSFWGKFRQRDNLQQTVFIYSVKQYLDLVRSKSVDIQSVHAVTPECMMVTYSQKDDYNEGSNCANLAIAAFTTSHARIQLFKTMAKLGPRLLYFDTDSVIFVHKEGKWLPEVGNGLGQWSSELKFDEHIVRFVSCGPKVYSYETNTGRIQL
ncbi:uncharacterized protein LOC129595097 [Paramacrobiotus metropolitanus]|uniref:uncharacterized protein LOC129595097 n=1 Tax=Paramacrobiotus metropolitanus TaxID=2943436 RepID=UPI0024463845|nr:uncharacterized protein LOC129595097 [Paramacrobiotus metropolitanus]